jgi:hypothetical protein
VSDQGASQVKRRITGGSASSARDNRDPASLALGEHDGIVWASNRYWLTPAARVAPLLEQFNLSAEQAGSFEVNSTVRKTSDSGPRVGSLIGKPEDYPEQAAPVRHGLYDAHVRLSDRLAWLAVYQAEGGAMFGLPADDLAWLSDITGLLLSRPQAFDLGPDDHFGEVAVMCKGGSTSAPVAIVADVIRTVQPGSYGTGQDGGATYTARRTENLGPRVIGLLMSVKLEG